ncbi:MAG: hypothetical protein CL832_00750 [Crocinitomicaceae bacterium]|nr:hypothetical protein [Crocinitomicaceae bacterium]|tara:strand:- start:228 stop:467 length:240 start_codon:yes stop_codon:yes gene_type:complete
MIIKIQQWEQSKLYEIEIDSDNYPELSGMSQEEIKDHINLCLFDMDPIDPDCYDTLGDELMDCFTGTEGENDDELILIF